MYVQCLDQVGKVMKNVGEANVLVSIAGYRWTLNPLCVRHAPGETVSPESNSEHDVMSHMPNLI